MKPNPDNVPNHKGASMVLKFLNCKEVTPKPDLGDFLLASPTARVIRGNLEITQSVIDARPPGTAQRFTAGILYNCPWRGLEKEQRLIDELQIQLLAGRPAASMPWTVVAHSERVKCFVIPNYDPVFRKVVHPYVDRIDRYGILAWTEHYSLRHGLLSPNDRFRIQPDFANLRIAAVDVDFLYHVWQQVHQWVRAGIVRNRMDLELRLIAAGYHVRCNKRSGGLLEQPVISAPRGNLLRLTGSLYYRPEFGNEDAGNQDLNDPEVRKKRLGELRETVLKRLDFRAYHLIGHLFGKNEQVLVRKGMARHHLKLLVALRLFQNRS
jgi:hypothetical protein